MSPEITLTLIVLLAAVTLFVTEAIRADLTALLMLATLVIAGLVTPEEGVSGFANQAVITIWAVFILSAGLARTGVTAVLGRQILRLAGKGDRRLLALLMSATAMLSGFMNNIGVAAMFLPITMDVARLSRTPASRLLLPMAYGSLLGGMLVLIGTSSNLIISDFIREAGLRPLGLFDFTPVGIVILCASIGYILLIGRRLLPVRTTPHALSAGDRDARSHYGLEERLAMIIIPDESPLIGKTLAESRFGQALGINVLSVRRRDGARRTPEPDLTLQAGDRVIVLGRLDVLDGISGPPMLIAEEGVPAVSRLLSEKTGLAELLITTDSMFNGKTPVKIDARRSLRVNVIALRRGSMIRRTSLQDIVFQPGDRLLIQGSEESLEGMRDQPGFRRVGAAEAEEYDLDERMLFLRIPPKSPLAGRTIEETRIAALYGISILCIVRGEDEWRMPEPTSVLREGDGLIVEGRPVDLEILRGHQDLVIERNPRVDIHELEKGPLAIVELVLSPHTTLAGKNLRQLRFREKYGVSVLAIWRGERAYRTRLGDMPLRFGDAFLCYGPRERFEFLANERDFIVLKLDVQEKPRLNKAPLAALIMAGVVAAVLLDLLPISVAAITGASLMVLSRCLSMEEAYRSIEWKAVFLIAAMLPMGTALQKTGATALLATIIINAVGSHGPTAVLAGIMILTLATNQFIPSTVNAVVMTPIAIATASGMSVSPYPFVMGIAYAVAAGFMSPLSHPVNVLVMSPGGYRFSDYIKNGLPLSLIVLLISLLLIPVIFPF